MTIKLVFMSLTLLFGGLTIWLYKKSAHTDDFGAGLVVLVLLILTVICALGAFTLPIKHF